jgi:plastocyanin
VLWSAPPNHAASARKPATHTVTIEASRYDPEELTVNAGDTVIWVNKDLVAHTATSQAGRFDSGIIVPGKSWRYKANRTGEFAYTCTYHPTMKATLRVK